MSVTLTYNQPIWVDVIVDEAAAAVEKIQTEEQKKTQRLVFERPDFAAINKDVKLAGTKYLLRTTLTLEKNVVVAEGSAPVVDEIAVSDLRAVHVSNLPQYENEARGEPYVAVVFETNPGKKEVSSKSRHYMSAQQLDFKKDMGAATVTLHDRTLLPMHIADFLLNNVSPA